MLPLLLLTTLSAFDLIGAQLAGEAMPCLPGISAVDWRVDTRGEAGAVIWWCEEGQHGLREHSRVSSRGASAVEKLLLDARNAEFILDSAPFRLRPSEVDVMLVAQLRRRYTPRCSAIDAKVTDSTGAEIGELRPGQLLSCGGLRNLETVQICQASGAPQSDGTPLPADSWIRCEMLRAPQEGWDY